MGFKEDENETLVRPPAFGRKIPGISTAHPPSFGGGGRMVDGSTHDKKNNIASVFDLTKRADNVR